MTAGQVFRVLMVCTGNICRSPTAHGVLEKMVADAGLSDRIAVDSAGTHGYHVGEPPDARSQAHAKSVFTISSAPRQYLCGMGC